MGMLKIQYFCFTKTWLCEHILDSNVCAQFSHCDRWCNPGQVTASESQCNAGFKLLAVSFHLCSPPREFTSVTCWCATWHRQLTAKENKTPQCVHVNLWKFPPCLSLTYCYSSTLTTLMLSFFLSLSFSLSNILCLHSERYQSLKEKRCLWIRPFYICCFPQILSFISIINQWHQSAHFGNILSHTSKYNYIFNLASQQKYQGRGPLSLIWVGFTWFEVLTDHIKQDVRLGYFWISTIYPSCHNRMVFLVPSLST